MRRENSFGISRVAERAMTFRRFGRSYHLRIETAEDLPGALELHPARWVALSAPTEALRLDATLLDLVDTDDNGRIMAYELRDAVRWLLKVLGDHSGIDEGSTSLDLEAINTDEPEGRRIRDSAAKILASLHEPEARRVTLDQVRSIKAQLEANPVSEGGVVLPAAAEDPDVRQFIEDIVATLGGSPHPSGQTGVTEAQLDAFASQARAYLDWHAEGRVPDGRGRTDVMPLNLATGEAFGLLAALREKIDQHFAQCRAVACDGRLAEQIAVGQAELASLDTTDPKAIDAFMAAAPLACPDPDGVLHFDGEVNPYYAGGLRQLAEKTVAAALGRRTDSLTEGQWQEVKEFFAAHEAWLGAKAGAALEPLGAEKLTKYLDGKYACAVHGILAESREAAFDLGNVRLIEKLILYQARMIALASNFVSFPDLYDPTKRALFEMGTLIMDGRTFDFSVRVKDREAHSALAKTSNMFVLYVEVALPEGAKESGEEFGKTHELAVPVTSGGKGNLCVGKRGVFCDLKGNRLDARVVQIIENPISLGEAFVSPFRRMGRLLSGKIESIATTAEKKLDAKASATFDAAKGDQAPKKQPATKGDSLRAGGLLMGGGVALAAVSSALAYIGKTLAGVAAWKILLGLAVAVLAVILPTSIIAVLKLRKRDLSAILEGAGWAINARMRLTLRQGKSFTKTPEYPPNAMGTSRAWGRRLLAVVLIAAAAGALAWRFWLR